MLTKTMIVDNVKPAAVSAYLYYDTRKSLIVNTKAWNFNHDHIKTHGRRKRGVRRGSDTPTIYVGGYWYVYPLET